MEFTTIRKNNKKVISGHINSAAVVAVFRQGGYHPMDKTTALTLVQEGKIRNVYLDNNERLTMDMTDRTIGQYVTTFPSLALAESHLYSKDYARIHPDNELAAFTRSH